VSEHLQKLKKSKKVKEKRRKKGAELNPAPPNGRVGSFLLCRFNPGLHEARTTAAGTRRVPFLNASLAHSCSCPRNKVSGTFRAGKRRRGSWTKSDPEVLNQLHTWVPTYGQPCQAQYLLGGHRRRQPAYIPCTNPYASYMFMREYSAQP